MENHSPQPDLLEPRYPAVPGYRRTETSREAARQIDPNALRAEILAAIKKTCPMTPDEVARIIEADRHSVRSRCSELKAKGKLRATGEKRPNDSGKMADVLEVAK